MAGRDIPFGPWHVEPELWDECEIAGKKWPGKAIVNGLKRANKFDEKKSKGKSGSKDEFLGVDPAEGTIVLKFWTAEQWKQAKELLPDIEPNIEKEKLEPVRVSHATFIARRVTAITIKEVTGPDTDGDGYLSLTVAFKEHREPSSTNATGSMKGGGKGYGKSLGVAGTCIALVTQRQQVQFDIAAMQAELNQLQSASGFQKGLNEVDDPQAIPRLEESIRNAQAALEAIGNQQRALNCDSMSPPEPSDPAPPAPEPDDPEPPPGDPFNPTWF